MYLNTLKFCNLVAIAFNERTNIKHTSSKKEFFPKKEATNEA